MSFYCTCAHVVEKKFDIKILVRILVYRKKSIIINIMRYSQKSTESWRLRGTALFSESLSSQSLSIKQCVKCNASLIHLCAHEPFGMSVTSEYVAPSAEEE